MQIKKENTKMKQSETANHLGYSSNTLQRYKIEIILVSFNRIQSNNTKKRTKTAKRTNIHNNSTRYPDLRRPQMTSNELK